MWPSWRTSSSSSSPPADQMEKPDRREAHVAAGLTWVGFIYLLTFPEESLVKR